MRVLLVGSAAARARVRAQMNGSMQIVAEYGTLASARAASIDADGILVADRRARDDDEDGLFVEEGLTPREVQVLELLAEGLPNKAIAERLGISDQTVKFHVSAISGKLGAANRTDAVRRAVRRGLIAL